MLPPDLLLRVGSLFKYNKHKNNKQNFVVSHFEVMSHSTLVYYVPEHTKVANASMFHYCLFVDYHVIKY
jgi:hypothetical protein